MQSEKQSFMVIGRIFLGALFLAVICGCQEPIMVRSAYGPGMSFSGKGSTFGWMPVAEKTTGNARLDNPGLHELIRSTVESGFIAKGYEHNPEGTPDFWIYYNIATKVRVDPYVQWGFEEYEEGSLRLAVINPQTRQVIWNGIAKTRLDDTYPPDVRRKRIKEAVRRMLERLPDRDKK